MSCSTRSNLYNYAPDCNNPIPLGVTMVSARQLEIAGTEPDEHPDVIDAAEELRRAKGDEKRAHDRVLMAQDALVNRLREHKAAVYEYSIDGARYRLDLIRADVRVKLTFVGNE